MMSAATPISAPPMSAETIVQTYRAAPEKSRGS